MTKKNNRQESWLSLYQETAENQHFADEQAITFYSTVCNQSLQGTILKKYTNSCLVDIQNSAGISKKRLTDLNNRIVVGYRFIEPQLK